MRDTFEEHEDALDVISQIFMLSINSAADVWSMVDRVVRICLCKHIGHDNELDVQRVKKIFLGKLRDEIDNPTYLEHFERCSVQTCIVVLSREVTMDYVRNAYYSRSTISDIFRAMNVDVSGAEQYLNELDDMFSPSQKCVLRLLYGEGCTIQQAAGMLGVTPNEVKTLQWQAMERLQQEWRLLRAGGQYQ